MMQSNEVWYFANKVCITLSRPTAIYLNKYVVLEKCKERKNCSRARSSCAPLVSFIVDLCYFICWISFQNEASPHSHSVLCAGWKFEIEPKVTSTAIEQYICGIQTENTDFNWIARAFSSNPLYFWSFVIFGRFFLVDFIFFLSFLFIVLIQFLYPMETGFNQSILFVKWRDNRIYRV